MNKLKIKGELSDKNKHKVDKLRYYELKYFCMQYDSWKLKIYDLEETLIRSKDISKPIEEKRNNNYISEIIYKKFQLERNINLIDKAASMTDLYFKQYLIIGVTKNASYDYLLTNYNIPCCREKYYQMYRKFFYILDQLKNPRNKHAI